MASLLGNVLIFCLAALVSVGALKLRQEAAAAVPAEEEEREASILISPDLFEPVREKSAEAEAEAAAPPPGTTAPGFTRTSEDQRGKRPDKPMFIGERDTEAASDRTPDPGAPPLPSQRGIEPRDETEIETTESRYRDGPLEESAGPPGSGEAAPPVPPAPAVQEPPAPSSPASPAAVPAAEGKEIADQAAPEVPKSEELVQGPDPVDVPVPAPAPEKVEPSVPPAPPAEKADTAKAEEKPPAPAKPRSPASGQPGFRGYQRKTAIRGSISRSGRSALDVADSPLGRYQAAISRAVEQEWQRNCVRHRDFITPGFLTVRFFIEPTGKVKSVQFVGEMHTGEIQKGFTLNSIRNADIPAMPKEIRADYQDEPLELIFNFIF